MAAVSCFGCCESIVRSSAYDIEWLGVSCMYKLNSVGERTEHCRNPFA